MSPAIVVALAALLCMFGEGCARKYWRKQADQLSYNLIRDKQSDPRWVVDRVKVETDPRSRFFEAFDPDFEPLPPDDLGAHEFMHWAYGRRGWKHWHEFGDQASVDNPKWLEPFGWPRETVEANMGRPGKWPELKLTLEDMIDLAYIHNRDYQSQIETLYLTALTLTLQRFAFDVQFVGLNGLRPSGTLTLTDIPSTSDSAAFSPNVGVQQLLPSGGQWLVNLANNTLWLFSKGNPSEATASTLTYSLVQPLLANGGRRFVMENLTQAERNLLYAARDLARYRMGFFTSIVAGGFTAGIQVGIPGVFSGTGPIPTPVPQIGTGGNGGFLGVLQLYQQVSNTEYNIRQLSEQLERLRAQAAEKEFSENLPALPPNLAIPEAFAGRVEYDADRKLLRLHGTLNEVEVRSLLGLSEDADWQKAIAFLADRSNVLTTNQNIVQLETQLASTVNQLRSARVSYLNGFDQLKLWLGLPVDMNVTVDTSMLKPFELVDARLIRLQDRLNSFVLEPPPIMEEHPDVDSMRRVTDLMNRLDEKNPDPAVVRGLIDEMLDIRDDLKRDGVDVTEDDFRRFEEHRRHSVPFVNDYPIQKVRDPLRDARLMQTLLIDFRESEEQLLKLKEAVGPDVKTEELRDALGILGDLREEFLRISQNFSVIQIDLRVELIDLNPFDMSMEDTVAVGLANRLDLMNLRGAAMDARRKVEVAANQLQAVVNLVANGNIQTQPLAAGNHNPFDFRGVDSNFQVGIQFTTPVQLVAQRNAYRAALVGYQQARRNYQRTEDQVRLDCRTNWRSLEFTRRNFETLREQIRAATAQLDIAAEQTAAPAGPVGAAPAPAAGAPAGGGVGGGAGGAAGGAGTAQGLQIIQAITSVLNAQNQLIIQWVAYEAFRLDIYNFMGTLEVDREGYWTDEFYQARARAHRANPNRLYPPVMREDSGYGPPSAPPDMDGSIYVNNDAGPATLPPAAKLTRDTGPKAPAGQIQLVGGEAPAKSPRKGGAKAATSSQEWAGTDRSTPPAKEAPGRARVTRRASIAPRNKPIAAPIQNEDPASQNRNR
jgi:hypothetical protein